MKPTRRQKRKRKVTIEEESNEPVRKKKINSWRNLKIETIKNEIPKKKRKNPGKKQGSPISESSDQTDKSNVIRWGLLGNESNQDVSGSGDASSTGNEEAVIPRKRYNLRSKPIKAEPVIVAAIESFRKPKRRSKRKNQRGVEADPDVTFLEFLPKKKNAPKKAKRKRKKHKLHFREILDKVLPDCQFEVHSASAQFFACFFHAVFQRKIKFKELRNYIEQSCTLIDERPDIFEIDYLCTKQRRETIVEQLREWLQLSEFKESHLPRRLWSPLPLVLAMAVLLEKDIVVMSHIRTGSRRNSARSLQSQSTIIAERFGADGKISTVNDHNHSELGPLYEADKLRLLYWPRANAGHWSYVEIISPCEYMTDD